MICRCITCNTATNVSLQRGVQIKDYRCYCGGLLKKAMVTYLDGEHPSDPSKTLIGQYGNRKGLPYFQAFRWPYVKNAAFLSLRFLMGANLAGGNLPAFCFVNSDNKLLDLGSSKF